ncbi:hypothetical protein ACVWYH_008163 [Bradyrhizobium sp. GM24.11]
MPEKKKVGRPRKYAGRRPTWTIRLEPEIGESVRKRASETGRSISEVCEAMITGFSQLEVEIEKLRADQKDTAIAFRVAHGRMEVAEAELAQTKVLETLVERAVRRALMPKRKHQIRVAQSARNSRNKGD